VKDCGQKLMFMVVAILLVVADGTYFHFTLKRENSLRVFLSHLLKRSVTLLFLYRLHFARSISSSGCSSRIFTGFALLY